MRISRRIDVDGLQLLVVDDCFTSDQIAETYSLLRDLPYWLNDYDTADTKAVRHLRSEFPLAMAETAPVFKDCVRIARELLVPPPVTLDFVHANMVLYGDLQHAHRDIADGVTAVYYANPDWQDAWQGETVFYDSAGEPLHAVAPKPGRLAIFHSNMLHRSGVPSRVCFEPRISVAFKFSPE